LNEKVKGLVFVFILNFFHEITQAWLVVFGYLAVVAQVTAV
jgi:hypothetical protein